jgi:hypothetical protein
MISYGQRATMVSFSALLAISLAFAHLQTGWDRIQYSGLILLEVYLYCFFNFLFILDRTGMLNCKLPNASN